MSKQGRELNGTAVWKRCLVFGIFVFLGMLIKLTQHNARELQYNFLCPIIVVSLAKLLCSLLLYAHFDGPLSGLPRNLADLGVVIWRYSVVSGLYCMYDVLSFVNLGIFDPQTYLVFLQLRTVLIAVVWEAAFAKPLSWLQRGSLVLICLSCVAKQIRGGFVWDSASRVSPGSYLLLALQVACNCMAGVANEVLLKSKGGAPPNLQNLVQYLWTICWCLLVGLLCPLQGVHLNPLDLEEWAKMADPRMLPSIVVLTVLGLVTSLMLRLLDSVWKAIATAVELFLTSYASALLFGYPVRSTDLLALCVGALGVGLYAWGGARTVPERRGPKKDS